MTITFEELIAMHHNVAQTTDAMIKLLEVPTQFIDQIQIIAQATKSMSSLLHQVFEKNGVKLP